MTETEKADQDFERLKGEYLSLMASTEYLLTSLIGEMLDVRHHPDLFKRWLVRTSIPFDSKADLFVSLVEDNTQLDQFRTLVTSLRSLNKFRNHLAHSFPGFSGSMTARGRLIPSDKISLNTLKSRLGQLSDANSLILNMLADFEEGGHLPISADDIADQPI